MGPLLLLNQVDKRRGTPSTSFHYAKGFVRDRLLTNAKRFLEAPAPRPQQLVSVHMTNDIRGRFVHPRHRQDQDTSGDTKNNTSFVISYQGETYGLNEEPQSTPEDPKSRQSGDTRRLKEGFWLSKAVRFAVALPFCLQFNKQNNLRRSMGFRLSISSFVLLGREHFPRVLNSIACLSAYTGDVSLPKRSRKRHSNIRHQPDFECPKKNNPTGGL